MIKKENRLKKPRQIKMVFDKGRSISGGFFKIRLFKKFARFANDPSKIAVIISKKFSKKAVERNLAKRRILAASARHLKNSRGFDIVVLPNKRVLTENYNDMEVDFEKCLKYLLSN
jgi:ribonuclease P protein component